MAPGFEGVDEADARELMAGAKDQMLAATRKAGGRQLADALSVVARLVTENTFDEVVDNLGFEAPMVTRAEAAYGPQGLIAALYSALGLTPGQTAEQVRIRAVQADAMDEVGVRQLGAALLSGSKSDIGRGDHITGFTAAGEEERIAAFAAYTRCLLYPPSAAAEEDNGDTRSRRGTQNNP